MATVYPIYRSRIDYDYDQSKMDEQNMRDLESDDDYLAANRELAVWLLDQYGKRSVGACEAR